MVTAARSLVLALIASAAVSVMLAARWTSTDGDALAADSGRFAYSIEITGEIGRGTSRDLKRALEDAKAKRAAVVILRLDTPGGLVSTTREMVTDIAAAPMPVIVYVYPSGGHAGSAGAMLTLAADAAAMAPGTNIGSATPVLIGPPARGAAQERLLRDLQRKSLNDSVAFARSLAEEHGHNADLSARMVRDAANVSAARARHENVVDVVAPSERAVLRRLDGFRIKGRKAQRLRTAGLPIRRTSVELIDVDTGDDLDNSSLARSLAYIIGPFAAMMLALLALRRARPRYRRWRRLRRLRSR